MTFEEWWDSSTLKNTPETFYGWEASCRESFYAGRKSIDLNAMTELIHSYTDASRQESKEIVRMFINKQSNSYLPEA